MQIAESDSVCDVCISRCSANWKFDKFVQKAPHACYAKNTGAAFWRWHKFSAIADEDDSRLPFVCSDTQRQD